jgi:hypothetical protein
LELNLLARGSCLERNALWRQKEKRQPSRAAETCVARCLAHLDARARAHCPRPPAPQTQLAHAKDLPNLHTTNELLRTIIVNHQQPGQTNPPTNLVPPPPYLSSTSTTHLLFPSFLPFSPKQLRNQCLVETPLGRLASILLTHLVASAVHQPAALLSPSPFRDHRNSTACRYVLRALIPPLPHTPYTCLAHERLPCFWL